MKKYKSVYKESTFKSIALFYDNRDFRVAKSKDSYKQFRSDLIKNGYKGIAQVPISIFDDDFSWENFPKYSGKTYNNMSDFLRNYTSIDEIREI